MSIELKITGDTPEKFRVNALGALIVLMGRSPVPQQARVEVAPQPAAEQPAAEQPEVTATPPAETAVEAEPLANPSASEAPPEQEQPKRGRGRPKKTETIEAKAEPVPAEQKADPLPPPGQPPGQPEELNDAIPEFLQPPAEAQTEAPAEPEKTYTEADCREAVRSIFAAYETRERAARGVAQMNKQAADAAERAIMADKVKYTLPLLQHFGVQKVSDLKAGQYGPFVQLAQRYIEGKV